MSDLGLYFETGWHHIISVDATDHLLFILALSSIYLLKDWKQVLVLVTAFTIGHSATLAMSVYDVFRLPDRWVEFLVPCTIIATATYNLFQRDFTPAAIRLNYAMALFFGLIHGMGFANTIRFMLAKDESIGLPLLGFNLGLEAGQILVVNLILQLNYLFVQVLHIRRTWWIRIIGSATLLIAIWFAIDRFPLNN